MQDLESKLILEQNEEIERLNKEREAQKKVAL